MFSWNSECDIKTVVNTTELNTGFPHVAYHFVSYYGNYLVVA